MLHRHFDFAPGELLVNYNGSSSAWSATPGPGMDKPQPSMWGFNPKGELIPTEYRYAKGHKVGMGDKELAFVAKFKDLLDQMNLAEQLGLVEYAGDDYEGSCEITMGSVNVDLKPKDVRQPLSQSPSLTNLSPQFPEGLVQTDTAWFFSPELQKRGCRCTCDNRSDPHGHGAHVITQSA